MAELNLGTLYDFNKEAMKNEKPLDPIQFNALTKDVSLDMLSKCIINDQHYWMLLCHERRDYTVFNIIACEEDVKDIEVELRPTLSNRGTIISIGKQPDEVWEIWIRDIETEENFVYYLFPYDNGVIEVNN